MKRTSEEISLKWVALTMIGVALIFFITGMVLVYVGIVWLVFTAFIYHHRSHWQVFGPWGGTANLLTALRGVLLLGVAGASDVLPPYVSLSLGILILVLDGLDGYYARKHHTVSAFGDVLDKEVDALFVLTFAIIIVDQQWAGSWILLPGLLRYGYVVGLSLSEHPPSPTGPSFRRRFVGMWLMGTLLAPFALPSVVYTPALIFATVTTSVSFMIDFYCALRTQSAVEV